MRYIELNPVRAGMVADPADYSWSSYRFNALGQADDLVTPHDEYHRLGNDDNEHRLAYRALFNQAISETRINEIRDATNKAWALGDGRFKERIQLQLARRVEPAARGGDRKSAQFKVNRVC
jgi:putative transposase